MPEDLPPGYYLENFHYLLNFVTERYSHLLNDAERAFKQDFDTLDEDSQKLLVRLTNRKGLYFRIDRLNYPELASLETSVERLVSAGFLNRQAPPLEHALALCTRTELRDHELGRACPASTRKEALVANFLSKNVIPLTQLGIKTVTLLRQEVFDVYRLLFFGNFHQDMTEFVLNELVSPYERYALDKDNNLFQDREVVEKLLTQKSLGDIISELIEADDSDDQEQQLQPCLVLLPDPGDEPLLIRRHDRLVNRVGRQLERLGCDDAALVAYGLARRSPARERQARVFARQGNPQEAYAMCQNILLAPANEEELMFAESFGARLARKHRLAEPGTTVSNLCIEASPQALHPHPKSCRPQDKLIAQSELCVPRLSARAEENARLYFSDQGEICFYVENTLLRSLFGLCFWDIIFLPVRGAFFHPFQRGPADLYTADFVASRELEIATRLVQLETSLPAIVQARFVEKAGINNPFVSWGYLDSTLLELALDHIPTSDLISVFKRMLLDLKRNTTGLPDLISFSREGYRMIEIKGPGDKLQKNQTRWFQFFQRESIPAEVINLTYAK